MPLLRATKVLTATDEPSLPRRLTLSLPLMAVLTGAAIRTYRAIVLQFGWSDSWLWIAGTLVAGAVFLFLMATLYLGNFPAKSWLWRAPAFALLEACTEILVSLGLTLLGLEQVGSADGTLADWQFAAAQILFFRVAGIVTFAAILAVVSTIVRILLLRGRGVHS